ncbi:hypothetical protein WH95_05835 [Kiloniella litopenaei]|uniref:Lipoprotein n=1 Tax=Kiloniella litopenaei TaxID=1549748 RepID=A0A0M2R8D6_9PROT|nr:hypothetical protein [Kiloniella litopenaei]KKJ77936.1 hypothetical protein WH95_05835 [Kiloniella litopenaei]
MVSLLKIFFPVVLCLSLLSGCFDAGGATGENYSKDIDKVRNHVVNGQSNADLVGELAGRHGKVTWLAGPWDDKQSDQQILVSASIRKKLDNADRELTLLYRYDRTSQDVVLDKVLLDGQVQSVVGGAVAMLAMKLE